MDEPRFKVGDSVKKVGGDYGGPGVVVSVFEPKPGAWRYAVAHHIQGGFGRFIHIYNERLLDSDEKERREG